jgi:hypothetical protein
VSDWTDPEDAAYHFLESWFLARYEPPVEVCPWDGAEGGYQWIWGGPYDAEEALTDTWGDIFTEDFLADVAARLCEEADCDEWSGMVEKRA